MDAIEMHIYSLICSHEGIMAKEIGKLTGQTRKSINHYLHGSPYMKELCYQDKQYRWHGMIRQDIPHRGLENFSGYYGFADEFLKLEFPEFQNILKQGCRNIGRNLNDTRGLFHSFEDTYYTMKSLFDDLRMHGITELAWETWEVSFELRIKKARYIRIYGDVILITGQKVFSLEFKMKDSLEEADIRQAAKYCEYLEVLFGQDYDVIPALVLTTGQGIYEEAELDQTTAMVPVCSKDQLHRLIEEYCMVELKYAIR